MIFDSNHSRREFLHASGSAAVGTAMLAIASRKSRAQNGESWPRSGYDSTNSGYAPGNTGPVSNIEEHWTFETSDKVSTPVVVNDTAYFGSSSGNLYAVDVSSGKQEWVFEAGGNELLMPTVTNDIVYIGSKGLDDNYTYALDAGTGKQRWNFDTYGSYGSPAVVDDTVYIGGVNAIYAVDAVSGEQRWEFHTGSGINSPPAVVDDTVYIANSDGSLLALDATSGDTRWNFSTYIDRWAPAVVDGTAYFTGSGIVYAVDTTSGDQQWTVDTGDRLIGSPAVTHDTIYIGSAASKMYALSSTSGNQRWVFESGAQVYGAPAVVDKTVYVRSHFNSGNHKLYAVDVNSGNKQWEFETESWVIPSPAVVDGTIYFGSGNKVYALNGQTSIPAPTTNLSENSSIAESTDNEESNSFPIVLAVLGIGGVGAWWLSRSGGDSGGGSSNDPTAGNPSLTTKSEEAQKLIDASKKAIDEHEFKTAADRISKVDSIIEDVGTDSDFDGKQLNSDVDDLEQRLLSEVRKEVQDLSSKAKERYEESCAEFEAGDYEKEYNQAISLLKSALDSLNEAEELCNRHEVGYKDIIAEQKAEIQSLLKTAAKRPAADLTIKIQQAAKISKVVRNRVDQPVDEIESTVKELEAQRDAIHRGIRSSDYDHAEEALQQFQDKISEFEELGEMESVTSTFRADAEELQQEIEERRASTRINGYFGAAGSSRSKAEQLLNDGAYDRAISRLESALSSLDQAQELNDRYNLGREDTIIEKKDKIQSLLETASNKPAEVLSTKLQKAEKAISNGIEARESGDVTAAVESFETALSLYEDACDLASQHDLSQQWEVEQRRSMVREYHEITQEALDERRWTVESSLEKTLESAESILRRAEQHVEVDDFVSARKSLTEARSQFDKAARLLETGLATEQFRIRFDEVSQREKQLREQLPDDESEGYRTRDLVESLQVLATKLGEPPRPEFVNQYGEYPADAYLETFGSWPEALAAANLDPIDESSRERRSYSRVEVLDAIVVLADELGHPPSKSEMNQKGAMSASPVQSRFNDWETALEVAGVTGEGTEEDSEAADADESKEKDERKDGILGEIESEIQGFGSK